MKNFLQRNETYLKSLKEGDIVDAMTNYPWSEEITKMKIGRISDYSDDLDNPMSVVLIEIDDTIENPRGFISCSVIYIVTPK
jgi:hypothetical protein